VCDKVQTAGVWSDLIDPASGYPVRGRQGSTLYSEIDGTPPCPFFLSLIELTVYCVFIYLYYYCCNCFHPLIAAIGYVF
jgi:hypothetical protein